MSSLTWYELLGVDADATAAEIKAAWRDATDKFEPGTGGRQFSLFNEAADVLLNPERRAAYDAELAAEAVGAASQDGPETSAPGAPQDEAPAPEPAPDEIATSADETGKVESEGGVEPDADVEAGGEVEDETPPDADDVAADEQDPTDAGEDVPSATAPGRVRALARAATNGLTSTLGLAILAVLTVLSLVLAGVLFFRADLGEQAEIAKARSEAQSVAQRAMAVTLSYDYRKMEEDRAAAVSYMTPEYAEKFNRPFDALAKPKGTTPSVAESRKSVVSGVVQSVGVMDASPSRVRLLVYVDQNVTDNVVGTAVLENRVIVTMVKRGGKWLIGDLETRGADCPQCAPSTPQTTPGATSSPSAQPSGTP